MFVGLVFAAADAGGDRLGTQAFDEVVAHSMGLVTFSMFHLFFSLETANEERTLFSSELLENGTLLKASGLSLLTIFLATTFGPLQRMLDTTELTVQQWALCIVVASVDHRDRRDPEVLPPTTSARGRGADPAARGRSSGLLNGDGPSRAQRAR